MAYYLNHWNAQYSEAERAEKFLVGRWLEKTWSDVQEFSAPQLFSSFQLITMLADLIPRYLIDATRYSTIRPLLEALQHRAKDERTWLVRSFGVEACYLSKELKELTIKKQDRENKTALLKLGEVLHAFSQKLNSRGVVSIQREALRNLSSWSDDTEEHLFVLETALDELLADLLYCGHSADYLNRWMLRIFAGSADGQQDTYLSRLCVVPGLGTDSRYAVFVCAADPKVDAIGRFETSKSIPQEYREWNNYDETIRRLPAEQISERSSSDVWAWLVGEINAKDPQAAIDRSVDEIQRLFTTQLGGRPFHRNRRHRHLVAWKRDNQEGAFIGAFGETARTRLERFRNAHFLYEVAKSHYNQETFETLERMLYWYQKASRGTAPLESKFTSIWAATEHLFSVRGVPQNKKERPVDRIKRYMTPYIVLDYVRTLLVDLIWSAERGDVDLESALGADLKDQTQGERFDLSKLLQACRGKGSGLIEIFANDPVLQMKAIRVAAVCPSDEGNQEVLKVLRSMEKDVEFDIEAIYVMRNLLVHGVSNDLPSVERGFRRLLFYLAMTLDQVFFRFRFNSLVGLAALHIAFRAQYDYLLEQLEKGQVAPSEIVHPDVMFLTRG
ncbi:hypothetical protein KAX17_02350 [Candidatus Bipolaricaulota bacterium]|nr:hypothetical protein [Candidatus Bipolaricaulota bacterium]